MDVWAGRKVTEARRIVAAEEPVCWLCNGLIDFGLPAGHPWSFEVDHVVPRAHGGTDDRHNLRASHRKCNNERWNKPARAAGPKRRTSRDW